MSVREALDRTLLLMRDHLRDTVVDDLLLDGLLGTRVTLASDPANLTTHSAQTALVTAALLLARAGSTVFVDAPNVVLLGPQPPLRQMRLLDALVEIDGQIIPQRSFIPGPPRRRVDLAIQLGDSKSATDAEHRVSINANNWGAWLSDGQFATRWVGGQWPVGALAGAALAGGEGYKVALRKLRKWRRNDIFDEFFAPAHNAYVQLAPNSTRTIGDLGKVDFVSAGAITHSALFALGRIVGARGNVRVIDPEQYDLSNSNRYMLLRLDRLYLSKALDLMSQAIGGLTIAGLASRFEPLASPRIGPLGPAVLVGVDHIPTRWFVQDAEPDWLGIGATSHYYTMFTAHQRHTVCARCAHPYDDPGTDRIPTTAFVSFWAGLFLASRYLRHLAEGAEHFAEQQMEFCPLRPEESLHLTPVHPLLSCRCCGRRITERAVLAEMLPN